MDSDTTGVVAKRLGKNFIGIEKLVRSFKILKKHFMNNK